MKYAVMFGSLFLLIGILSGCSRFSMQDPEGFAEVTGQGRNRYVSVTPEGMKLSVRLERNYPRQNTAFWEKALGKQLSDEGYTLVSGPATFETGTRKGVYFVWGLPYNGKNYSYLTGFITAGKDIVIIEAGAELSVFNRYMNAVLTSIENMNVR